MLGLWLLIPELQRLQVWDLLRGWTGSRGADDIDCRVALQLINEAALCQRSTRRSRTFNLRGFELASGLPYITTDQAIHHLLEPIGVAQTQQLQVGLGKIRRASGHFPGNVLSLDPHRMPSFSKRRMVIKRPDPESRATKLSQCFFCLDLTATEAVCCTLGSSSRTATSGTKELLEIARLILDPQPGPSLLIADNEHFTTELVDYISRETPFDLLVPFPAQPCYKKRHLELTDEDFTSHWAGFATAVKPFTFREHPDLPLYSLTQRIGEDPDDYHYRSFLSTGPIDEVKALTENYPARWDIEEFFNLYQDIGWKRAGTMNQNIRYGSMTMALIAQAAISQLRQRVGGKISTWDSRHLAQSLFQGLDGDLRVKGDTIIITLYNAERFGLSQDAYKNLPQQLEKEGVDPRVPWLFGFKIDFRFR
jgi:hypothetical protein